MDVQNRVAIVTGGAQGIGLAIATLLAQRGAKVALTDVNKDKAVAEAEKLKAQGIVDIKKAAALRTRPGGACGDGKLGGEFLSCAANGGAICFKI